MSLAKKKTIYFREAGKQNTDPLLGFVKEYVDKEGIKDIVVASTSGETGKKASKIFKGYNLVIVTHCFGFQEPEKLSCLRSIEKRFWRMEQRFSQASMP